MTLSPWLIYMFGIADSISCAANILFTVSLLTTLPLGAFYLLNGGDDDDAPQGKMLCSWFRRSWITCCVSFVFAALLPSSKVIAMMVVLPAIVNSEPIQKDLPEVYRMAIDALKKELSGEPEKK